jgi:hypothetical protein
MKSTEARLGSFIEDNFLENKSRFTKKEMVSFAEYNAAALQKRVSSYCLAKEEGKRSNRRCDIQCEFCRGVSAETGE